MTTRKQYSPKFKALVAIESIRAELFVDGRTRKGRNGEADNDALYEEIGRLKVELDWLKKQVGMLD